MNNVHKFKVGDYVTGNDKNKYYITNKDSVCRVIRVFSYFDKDSYDFTSRMDVELISHKDEIKKNMFASPTTEVAQDLFDLCDKDGNILKSNPPKGSLFEIHADLGCEATIEYPTLDPLMDMFKKYNYLICKGEYRGYSFEFKKLES